MNDSDFSKSIGSFLGPGTSPFQLREANHTPDFRPVKTPRMKFYARNCGKKGRKVIRLDAFHGSKSTQKFAPRCKFVGRGESNPSKGTGGYGRRPDRSGAGRRTESCDPVSAPRSGRLRAARRRLRAARPAACISAAGLEE